MIFAINISQVGDDGENEEYNFFSKLLTGNDDILQHINVMTTEEYIASQSDDHPEGKPISHLISL